MVDYLWLPCHLTRINAHCPVRNCLGVAKEEFGTEPGLGETEDDQRDGIPVRAEVAVPGSGGTESAEENAYASTDTERGAWDCKEPTVR
jgi:hypothetical protein